MPVCESCGNALLGEGACSRCGNPVLTGEAARLVGESSDLLAVGQVELSLRKAQQAVKSAPDSWIPRLRLAELYWKKAESGEAALERLGDREMAEAMRLGPAEKAVHTAHIARISRSGDFEALRTEYKARLEGLPVAEECLKMIDAMETSAKLLDEGEKIGSAGAGYRAKMFAGSAIITMVAGGAILVKMALKGLNDPEYRMIGGKDFIMAAVFVTATLALGLEFLRASGKLKK